MIEEEPQRRKRGRPRMHPVDGSRRNVTFNIGEDIYNRICKSADDAGLSIGREIESRLEMSFKEIDILMRYLGGQTPSDISQACSMISRHIERSSGNKVDESVLSKYIFHMIISRFIDIYFDAKGNLPKDSTNDPDLIKKANETAETVYAAMGLASKM